MAKDTGDKNGEGTTYINFAGVYAHLRDFKKAMENYQLAISIANETGNKDAEQRGYDNLACVLWFLGDYFKAEQCFKSCIELVEEMTVLLQGNDEWKIAFRNERDCVSRLVRLQLQQRTERKTLEALLTAERGRAEALVDLLESQYGVRKSICSLSKQQTELIISKHISSPTLFLMNDTKSVNIWMLLKGGKQCGFVQQGVSNDLTSMTYQTYKQIGVNKSLWKKILSRKEIEDQGGALKVLYDMIIAPFSHSIEGDELVIVPDGSSFLIPYAALVDQNSRYLSETLRIRLVPSLTTLRLLAECPEGRHSTSGALLVGNPWVETVRIKGCRPFPQLPGTEEEVKMVGQSLNIAPLTGKNATKDRVLSGLNSVSLVHIAAHGRTETGEIILSPNFPAAKRPKEKDFLLTMADVLDAKVHAKLVVLSYANSGRGKIKVEGVVGIARAFLGAGARSVIATLWEIDDEATLAFMRHFYDHLLAGQSASKSLHHAMKRIRESEKFNAVKHWAPFVLIGDDVTLNFGQ
ncbi:tetratricopeptide repeat protein 28-like [Porites lutea]|uniref:tetratricopeptide repeat protein 28-like n=1 Tax=Porites lutea TaxID=51062 RepID=UPI003CC59F69